VVCPLPSPPPHILLLYLLLLDLINGMDPTTDSDYAEVFGGAPGNPSNIYMQWEIQANSDNSIRYSSFLFPSSSFSLLLVS